MTNHMDKHYNINKEIWNSKGIIKRPQFSSISQWINVTPLLWPLWEDDTEAEEYLLPYDKKNISCFVCGDEFKLLKLKENDEWCFTNALKVRINKSEIKVHASSCVR